MVYITLILILSAPLGAWSIIAEGESATKPHLSLTFSSLLSRSGSSIIAVESDVAALSLAVHDTLYRQGGVNSSVLLDVNSSGPEDGTILDFRAGRRYQHQRFFDETVCFELDLPLKVNFTAPTEEESTMQQAAFMGALAQVLGVPLELYDAMAEFQGQKQLVRGDCGVWTAEVAQLVPFNTKQAKPEVTFTHPLMQFGNGTAQVELALQQYQDERQATTQSLEDGADLALSTYANVSYCVNEDGDMLGVEFHRQALVVRQVNESTYEAISVLVNDTVVIEEVGSFGRTPNASAFDPLHRAVGDRCVDLTQGTAGPTELSLHMNDAGRLARINVEAVGMWKAVEYADVEGATVGDINLALGADIAPLQLPLAGSAMLREQRQSEYDTLPWRFDPREKWPQCTSIGYIRNQGGCGSCWAFSAASVLADRYCVAALREKSAAGSNSSRGDAETLILSPQFLLECDGTNNGCSGGRLDDVWWYLRDHGLPSEACSPYQHCQVPTHRGCQYDDLDNFYSKKKKNQVQRSLSELEAVTGTDRTNSSKMCAMKDARCSNGGRLHTYSAEFVYAVAPPSGIQQLQLELITHGPVQVAMFVFSDFTSYKSGVYFRTPSAYGPLGGHAVRMLGWGVKNSTDYWQVANSWSVKWGMGGRFLIRRGVNECGIETMPAAGLPKTS